MVSSAQTRDCLGGGLEPHNLLAEYRHQKDAPKGPVHRQTESVSSRLCATKMSGSLGMHLSWGCLQNSPAGHPLASTCNSQHCCTSMLQLDITPNVTCISWQTTNTPATALQITLTSTGVQTDRLGLHYLSQRMGVPRAPLRWAQRDTVATRVKTRYVGGWVGGWVAERRATSGALIDWLGWLFLMCHMTWSVLVAGDHTQGWLDSWQSYPCLVVTTSTL